MTSTDSTIDDRIEVVLGRWLAEHSDALIALRRDLHANPELSGEEHRTTETVRRLVAAAGYTVRPMSIGTGLFAEQPGTTARLAFRADLDALAMHDLKDVSYRSRVDGVCHACGHDVHTTIGVGVAQFFADHPELISTSVRFIFQPAEERVPGGALEVVRDGGLDGIDAVVGVHCEPKLPSGAIGLRAGSITSAADMVTIELRGPGGHTARPELTVDTIALAAELVQRVPSIVDDATADDQVKLVFGAIHGGDAANVIPTSVELRASVRTPSLDTWEILESAVRAAVAEVISGTGAEVTIDYVRGVPPTVNDPRVIEAMRDAGERVLGLGGVTEAHQSWGGDDFAWLTREVPGAYLRLGVHEEGGPLLDLHAGRFDVDEHSIEIGIRLIATTLATLASGLPA
ncbi:MAG: amidohydrolase [Ilumatobacter sp.]